mmetsp:Transcript_23909/g.36587  ORF Transcript_23909/g.36587 Transcript_23909/m.36587 type:complete len:200 (-) Transcript_23909:8-607(-)
MRSTTITTTHLPTARAPTMPVLKTCTTRTTLNRSTPVTLTSTAKTMVTIRTPLMGLLTRKTLALAPLPNPNLDLESRRLGRPLARRILETKRKQIRAPKSTGTTPKPPWAPSNTELSPKLCRLEIGSFRPTRPRSTLEITVLSTLSLVSQVFKTIIFLNSVAVTPFPTPNRRVCPGPLRFPESVLLRPRTTTQARSVAS